MQRKEPRYINGEAYWQCSLCRQWLTTEHYYRDAESPNHIKSQCKHCHTQTSIRTRDPENARRIKRESMRRVRQTNPGKFRLRERFASRQRPKNEKTKARELLNSAVASGKVIRPTNCSQCGKLRKVAGHHRDYSKPFEVRWLCYECHGNQ